MKTFRVVYLPHHREDKEWVDVEATSEKEAVNNFKGGTILSIEEEI